MSISMRTGFQLAEQGAALAAAHADKVVIDWSMLAYAAFTAYAERHTEFTTEDVILASPNVPEAPEKRAWGHIALTAQRRGIVRSNGYTHSKLAHAHCRPITSWVSMVCRVVAA